MVAKQIAQISWITKQIVIHLDTFNKFKAYETTLESLKRAEKGPAAESGSGGAAESGARGGSRRHHLTRRKGVGKKSKQTRHSKK